MRTVLLVCDDDGQRRRMLRILRHGRFEAKTAHDLGAANRLLRSKRFDAVLVTDVDDVELPALVCELRILTELPMLVVSARADELGRVLALDAGADDCLTSPCGVDELLARLRAIMRRFARSVDEPPIVTPDFTVYVKDRRFLMADGSEASLTSTEWRIVEVLLRREGHLVSQSEVLSSVWGVDAVDKTQYLRVHMASIRRKVEPDPRRPRYFLTVPGLGLRFVSTPDPQQGSTACGA